MELQASAAWSRGDQRIKVLKDQERGKQGSGVAIAASRVAA
jgi:hypothetical protein